MSTFKKYEKWWRPLVQTRTFEELDSIASSDAFKRSLGPWSLTSINVGAIIGTGIFVLTGIVAANNAGPAVILSFGVAAIAAGFAALCYAELASMIPVSGSAYTYAYATLGELAAWMIGWDLVLEYAVGTATVAVGWSSYFRAFLKSISGVELPSQWTASPIVWDINAQEFQLTGNYVDLPSAIITLAVMGILVFGLKESANFNSILVVIKLIVIFLFLGFMAGKVNPENYQPFIPENTGTWGTYGVSGILQGATTVFFAYIGFDVISTTAQEAQNPQRNLPIGIIASLVLCTTLYMAVASVATGLVPYYAYKDVPDPIAFAIMQFPGYNWLAIIVEIGALMGITSVLISYTLGQPRIFYSMASDGLLPEMFGRVNSRFGTPAAATILTGCVQATCAAVLPIDILGELTSIGTLFAFAIVSLGVLILRKKRPDIPRKFKVPGGDYLVPICGVVSSLGLVFSASIATILRLFIWMFIGLIIYYFYGRKYSKLRERTVELEYERKHRRLSESVEEFIEQQSIDNRTGAELIPLENEDVVSHDDDEEQGFSTIQQQQIQQQQHYGQEHQNGEKREVSGDDEELGLELDMEQNHHQHKN